MKTYLTAQKFRDQAQRRRYIREAMSKKVMWVRTRSILPIREELMGDAKSHLHNIDQEPTRGSLRLYFQNINTLKIGQGRKETEEAFKRLSASGVSITLLSKVNKNMEMEEVMDKIQQVVQSGIPEALF